jgi:hypothetical protein
VSKFVGDFKNAVITIATDDDLTPEVDLLDLCDAIQVIIPALTSCKVSVMVSDVTGGTFVDLGNAQTTNTTTGSYATMFKLGGYRFIKIKTSAGQASNRTFKVRGWRY